MFRESTVRDEAPFHTLLRRALHAAYAQEPPPAAWTELAARLAQAPAPIIPQSTSTLHPGLLFIPELLLAG